MAPTSNRGTTSGRVLWNLLTIVVALIALSVLGTANSSTSRRSVTPASSPAVRAPAARAPDTPATCPKRSSTPVRSAPVGHKAAKTVALTFDDGPGPWTGKILKTLRDHQVKATFFVVGEMVVSRPEMVQQIKADGNAIANHSWSHPIPGSRSGWQARSLTRQISKTQAAVHRVVGAEPCYFRPPGGVVKGAHRVLEREHLSMVLWSVDTRDWTNTSASAIRKRARAGLDQQHPVILLHDGGSDPSATASALPGIIVDYRANGYEFVTFAGMQ